MGVSLVISHLVCTTNLLLVNFECISVRHVKCFWAICRLNPTSIEEKTDRSGSLALSLAESVHQLLKGRRPLDFEEDLVVVIGDLDVEVLTLTGSFGFLWRTWASIFVRARHVAVK